MNAEFITFFIGFGFGLLILNRDVVTATRETQLHNFMDESELNYYFSTDMEKKVIPEYELVQLKVKRKRDLSDNGNDHHSNDHIHHEFEFEAFDRLMNLKLKLNENLISPHVTVLAKGDRGETEEIYNNSGIIRKCFFLHKDNETIGAFSNCADNGFKGIILMPNQTLEIQPLNDRLRSLLSTQLSNASEASATFESSHIVKKVFAPEFIEEDTLSWRYRKTIKRRDKFTNTTTTTSEQPPISISTPSENSTSSTDPSIEHLEINEDDETRISSRQPRPVVELGIFFDEAAYRIFSPVLNYDDRKLSEMILAYANEIQALYHQRSLGTQIDITIVYIEIMRRQPSGMQTHNGERDMLLDSFCAYQKRLNPPDDWESNHWDIGLYISGLDFYTYENGRHSRSTLGLATVQGVCSSIYACVITEFGTTNVFGKPYPSAGFTSAYIAAHEIGHNLGMSHDSLGNHCSRDGYIMSPSRGTKGETTWSSCSAEIARSLSSWATCLKDRPTTTPSEYNAWKFRGFPGQVWSAKRQCEILLADVDSREAQSNGLESVCQSLQCRSPHRSGYYFAGPALEGTHCGNNRWCENGYCTQKRAVPKPTPVVPGGWSPWKKDRCLSGCITKSKGFQARRRTCDNPKPINTDEGCEGSSYDVMLCNDYRICRSTRRRTPISYASARCKEFSRKITDLDPTGLGVQAPHEAGRLWMGCAIFCRRRSTGTFYTPRIELNDLGLDPYFPDGTWCHADRTKNYFCQQHHCLPEGFQFNKVNVWTVSEDVPISGNANPEPMQSPNSKLVEYLSLDENGQPIRTQLEPGDLSDEQENEMWSDDEDFRELPKSVAGGLM